MTCVVVAKASNGVVMGADSRVTLDGSGRILNQFNHSKLIKFKHFVIGICGGGPITETLLQCLTFEAEDGEKLYDLKLNNKLDVIHFVKIVWGKLKEEVAASAYESKHEQLADSYGNMVIATKDKIFVAFPEMSVQEVDTFFAIGCGDELATGAMATMYEKRKTVETVKRQVIKSLKIACKFSSFCGEPIKTITMS